MRIGELSRRAGVNAHQLRYYEAQGLLEADRGANGYREYDENAVLRVKQIRHLRQTGNELIMHRIRADHSAC